VTARMVMELDPKQEEAVQLIVSGRIGVITGGPGTGKTTCLKTALDILRADGKVVALMAPTGKAARRMQEACNYPASTVHRALAWMDGVFTYGRSCPLEADVVICDEASMLDTELAASLFNAVDERRTSIFLVGDVNQLPSVGPGLVLGELIESGEVSTVWLETLHRSAQASWMNRNAPRILDGDFDALELGTAEDFAFVRLGPSDPSSLVQLIEDEVNRTMEITGARELHHVLEQMQVLIPQKRGPLGVNLANARLQEAFQGGTPDGGWKLPDDTMLFDGDKVMQTKNDYNLGLMNGEQGIVAGTHGGKQLVVDVDGDSYVYSREQSWNLQLSYATTIHKSQGSEWPVVLVVCHSSHGRMLSRELIYTAVTRAKKRVVIAGDEEGLARAVANDRVQERQTGLLQAVCEAAAGGY